MQNGEKIPFSKVKHSIVEAMIENGILKKQIHWKKQSIGISNRQKQT